MIEYVIPNNPDDRILNKASDFLKKGELVIFPTDTNWVVIADPFVKKGVENIYRFKGEGKSHHFSLLCDNITRASQVAVIDDWAYKLLRGKIPGSFTFIFEAKKNIIKALKASKSDHQIGVRFPPSDLPLKFIEFYNSPLLSTNIPKEKFSLDSKTDLYGYQIEEELGHQTLILDPGEINFMGQSTIIDFSQGTVELVREGAGDPNLFHL